MTLYNCKTDGDQYRVTKFSADLEIESSYLTTASACECPAGHRNTCRHRQMVPLFEAKRATAGQWFLDFDRKVWIRAIADVEFEAKEDILEAQDQESTVPVPELELDREEFLNEAAAELEALKSSASAHGFTMLDLARPLSPTATTTEFDSVDGGSIPSVAAQPLRRI